MYRNAPVGYSEVLFRLREQFNVVAIHASTLSFKSSNEMVPRPSVAECASVDGPTRLDARREN